MERPMGFCPVLKFRHSRGGLRQDKETRSMKYKILIRHSEEGYSVSVPGLPGCWSQGDTEEEAIENIRDAIQEYLAAVNGLFHDGEIREIEIAV